MNPASSPYVVFQASDLDPSVASPIGIGQCLRIKQKKYHRKNVMQQKRIGPSSKKAPLKSHVQLAFA